MRSDQDRGVPKESSRELLNQTEKDHEGGSWVVPEVIFTLMIVILKQCHLSGHLVLLLLLKMLNANEV